MRAGKKTDKGKYMKSGIFLAVMAVYIYSAASQAWGGTAEDGLQEIQWNIRGHYEDDKLAENGVNAVGGGEPRSGEDGWDVGEAGDGGGRGDTGDVGDAVDAEKAGNVGETGDEDDAGDAGDAEDAETGKDTGDPGEAEAGEDAGDAEEAEDGEDAGEISGDFGEPGGGENAGNVGDVGGADTGENSGDAGEPEGGNAAGNAGEPADTADGSPPGTQDTPPAVKQPDVLPGQSVPPVATSSEAASPTVLLEDAADEVTKVEDGNQLIEWLEDRKADGGKAILVNDITVGNDYIYSSSGWGKKQDVVVDTCGYSITIDADVDLSYYSNLTIHGQGTPESVIKITPDGRLFLAANTIYAYGAGQDTYIIDQQPGATLSIVPEYASMIQGNIRYSGFMTGELTDSGFPVYMAVPVGIREDEIELPQTARVLIYSNDGISIGGQNEHLPVIWDMSPVSEGRGENKRICVTGTLDTGEYPDLRIEDTLKCWLCYKTNDATILNVWIRSGSLTCAFYTDLAFESIALMWSEDGEQWHEEKSGPPYIMNGKFQLSHEIESGKSYYLCAKLVNGDHVSYSNVIHTDGARVLEAPDLDGGRGGGTDITGDSLPSVNRPSGSGEDTSTGGGGNISGQPSRPHEGDDNQSKGTQARKTQAVEDQAGGIEANPETVQPVPEIFDPTPDDMSESGYQKQENGRKDGRNDTSYNGQNNGPNDGRNIKADGDTRISGGSGTTAMSDSAGAADETAVASEAARTAVPRDTVAAGNPGASAVTAQFVMGAAASAGIIAASAWAGPDRILRGVRRFLKGWLGR